MFVYTESGTLILSSNIKFKFSHVVTTHCVASFNILLIHYKCWFYTPLNVALIVIKWYFCLTMLICIIRLHFMLFLLFNKGLVWVFRFVIFLFSYYNANDIYPFKKTVKHYYNTDKNQ